MKYKTVQENKRSERIKKRRKNKEKQIKRSKKNGNKKTENCQYYFLNLKN